MKNFIAPGEVLTLIAPSGGVTSGQGLVVGATFAVATHDAAQTLPFEGRVTGVVRLPKTASVNWVAGAKLYFVPGTGAVTNATTGGNFPIGVAAEARANEDTFANVRLDGIATVAL